MTPASCRTTPWRNSRARHHEKMKIETGDESAAEGRVRIDDPTTPSLRSHSTLLMAGMAGF